MVSPAGFEPATPGLEGPHSRVYEVAPVRWNPCIATDPGFGSIHAAAPKIPFPWLPGDAVVTDAMRRSRGQTTSRDRDRRENDSLRLFKPFPRAGSGSETLSRLETGCPVTPTTRFSILHPSRASPRSRPVPNLHKQCRIPDVTPRKFGIFLG